MIHFRKGFRIYKLAEKFLKNELYVTVQIMQHHVLPVTGHENYFLAGWAFSSIEWHYLISCCWFPYHRAHRKPVLFAEYLGINL